MDMQTDGMVPLAPLAEVESKDKNRFDKWWLLVIFVVGLIIYLATSQSDPYWRIIQFVQDGVWVSISTTVISFFLVLFVGLFVGLGRLSKNKAINGISTVYVEVIRGIPLLVQLMFWYFAFPSVIQSLGKSLNIESS